MPGLVEHSLRRLAKRRQKRIEDDSSYLVVKRLLDSHKGPVPDRRQMHSRRTSNRHAQLALLLFFHFRSSTSASSRPVSMERTLPDELVQEIIAHSMHILDELFNYPGVRSRCPRAAQPQPRSNTLLACKLWLRIGTPVLYECITIYTSPRAIALGATLSRNPFGRFIRRLRLEGDCWQYLEPQDIESTCNLAELCTTVGYQAGYTAQSLIVLLRRTTIHHVHMLSFRLMNTAYSTRNLSEILAILKTNSQLVR